MLFLDEIPYYPVGVNVKYPVKICGQDEFLTISEINYKFPGLDRICCVYILGWKDGTKYIGKKIAKGEFPTCIFTTYFSSSYDVHEKVRSDGKPEIIGIIECFLLEEEATQAEKNLLKIHQAAQRSDYLNHQNGDFFSRKIDRDWYFLRETSDYLFNSKLSNKAKIIKACKTILCKETNDEGLFNLTIREIIYWGIILDKSKEECLSRIDLVPQVNEVMASIIKILKSIKDYEGKECLWPIFLLEFETKYLEMTELYHQDPETFIRRYSIPYLYKNGIGLVPDPVDLIKDIVLKIKSYSLENKIETIWCLNAKDGTLPIVAQKEFPNARIICIEFFPHYVDHLKKLGFEVRLCEMKKEKKKRFLDFSEEEDLMKPDLIITNPPYQSNDQNGKRKSLSTNLWTKFIQFGFKWINQDGFVAMIVPPSWASPTIDINEDKISIMKNLFIPNNPTHFNLTSVNHHFPKVGSQFSYFIVQKATNQGRTQILDDVFIDTRKNTSLPRNINRECINICEKFRSKMTDNMTCKGQLQSGFMTYSSTEDSKFKFPAYHTQAVLKNGETWFTSVKHPDFDKHKIMFSLSGYFIPRMDSGTQGFTDMCLAYILKEDENLFYAFSVFSSKLYRLYLEMNKWSGFNPKEVIRSFPILDFSRSWTDQEIYEYFNLSSEEMNYIEKMIKDSVDQESLDLIIKQNSFRSNSTDLSDALFD